VSGTNRRKSTACSIRVLENPKQSQTTPKNPEKVQKDKGRETQIMLNSSKTLATKPKHFKN
jgi:hypothetical protein